MLKPVAIIFVFLSIILPKLSRVEPFNNNRAIAANNKFGLSNIVPQNWTMIFCLKVWKVIQEIRQQLLDHTYGTFTG
jgi:hypothetical protein